MKTAWKKPLEMVRCGVQGLGWTVMPAHWNQDFLYHTGTRKGSVNLHERHNSGKEKRWRFDVDHPSTPKGKIFSEHYGRPETYEGPEDKHEISAMEPELYEVSKWLILWLKAYEAGGTLPDMPDGTPYSGGRVFTKATRTHLGWVNE